MRSRPRSRRAERGFALAIGLIALATLGLAAASALLIGGAGIRATRNYRGASQVQFVAESGISEALQAINGPGVIDFQNDVVGQWSTLYGTGARAFAPLPGFSYSVTVVASATDPTSAGQLIATATGSEGVRNVVVADVLRSGVPSASPGAIHLASDAATNATFNGNAFEIDGNDHNYTGGFGPAAPVPAISTRTDANTQEVLASLSSGQADNVTGLGFSAGPPAVPSVHTSPVAPSAMQLDQIVADLLARAGVVTNSANQITGNSVFGTTATPQITYFDSSTGVTIKGTGNASGAGIMIVDGDLTIEGSFEFKGLVIVGGQTTIGSTTVTGNATVYGSIWTNDIDLIVGGSAITYYSSQALALANQVGGGGALPSPVQVTALANCAQLPPGVGGCP